MMSLLCLTTGIPVGIMVTLDDLRGNNGREAQAYLSFYLTRVESLYIQTSQ